jgi:3-polyprenyl-4-hydroxybenzoate decarboxylase
MDLHRAAVRAHKENKPLVLVVRRNGGRKRIRLEMGRK